MTEDDVLSAAVTASLTTPESTFQGRLDRALKCKEALEKARAASKRKPDEFVAAKEVSVAKLALKQARQAIKSDLTFQPHCRYDYRGHRFSVDKTGAVHICALAD